jgi:hypothetical protein
MADVEILGRPQYRSRKLQDEEQNLSTQQESNKRLTFLTLNMNEMRRSVGGVRMYD